MRAKYRAEGGRFGCGSGIAGVAEVGSPNLKVSSLKELLRMFFETCDFETLRLTAE
jgi:hypothetical protein